MKSEDKNKNRKSDPILVPGIGSRISAASKKIGARKDAANAGGISTDTLQRYIREEVSPSFEALSGIAKEAEVPLDWIAFGNTQIPIAEESPAYNSVHDYALKLKSNMERLAFKRSWIEKKGLKPSYLNIVKVFGDAMEPTIKDGWLTLVDMSPVHEKPTKDGLYAIMIDGQPRVKRLQLDARGGVWLRNDNPAYPDQYIEEIEDLFIIGLVIWVAGEI